MSDSSTNNKKGNLQPGPTFSGDDLADMVLDHMLANPELFVAPQSGATSKNTTDHFVAVLESLKALAHKAAIAGMANRNNLSTLPVMGNRIPGNPDETDSTDQYEVRYRLVEQNGIEPPVKDEVYSFEEAVDIYGKGFVEKYWGILGENCPRLITTGEDRQIWFSAVRYPVASLEMGEPELMASLDQATQPFKSTDKGSTHENGQPEATQSVTGQRQRTGYKAPSLK